MQPYSLDALPFVVRHGQTIWPLLVLAAGLGTVLVARWRRRRAGRRRIAEALARKVSPPSLWAHDVEATVRGVLRTDGAAPAPSVAAVGFSRGHEQAQLGSRAWPDAWLEVADGEQSRRVELTGPVAVIVGTAATRRRGIPTAQFDQGVIARDRVEGAGLLGRWRGPVLGFHVRTVTAGDEVLAAGRLTASAGGEQGYREGAARWTLAPVRDAIDLAAMRPAFDPPRLTLPTIVLYGGASALAMLVALGLLADKIDVTVDARPGHPVELSTAQALAAILPSERDDVLEALEEAMEQSRYADVATVRTLAGIAHEVRGCRSAAAVLLDHGHLDEALALAARCDDPDVHVRALVAHGLYGDAASLARHHGLESDAATLAYLASGAWEDAAQIVAAPFGRDPDAALAAIRGDEIGQMMGTGVCLAAALLARGDGPGVVADMIDLASRPGGESCAHLIADLVPLEQRDAWLASGPVEPDLPVEALIHPTWRPRLVSPRGDALVTAVLRAESAGDRDAVERLIGEQVPWLEEVTQVRAAITLRRGADLPIGSARGGLRMSHSSDEDFWIVDRALDGDLTALAARCQAGALPLDGRLWLALRHATAGRPAMATCLRHRPRDRGRPSVVAMLVQAGIERDLADAVGDTDAAASWQSIAARHAAVLADPATARLLAVWDARDVALGR